MKTPAGVAPGQRGRRRRLPAARPGERAARRRAQARRRTDSAGRQVDVRRQGHASPSTSTRRRSASSTAASSTSTLDPADADDRQLTSRRLGGRDKLEGFRLDGGCSSKVEHRTVAPDVAGSSPVIHPTSPPSGELPPLPDLGPAATLFRRNSAHVRSAFQRGISLAVAGRRCEKTFAVSATSPLPRSSLFLRTFGTRDCRRADAAAAGAPVRSRRSRTAAPTS